MFTVEKIYASVYVTRPVSEEKRTDKMMWEVNKGPLLLFLVSLCDRPAVVKRKKKKESRRSSEMYVQKRREKRKLLI